MTLHVETRGRGQPLVMLHGWGMHGGIWADTVAQLALDFEVHNVDLPGHGRSPVSEGGEAWLDAVAAALSRHFAGPVDVCGWSLGGIVAQHWAFRDPKKVRRLVLVASTPSFAAREDWPFGMPRETLEQFAQELEKNFSATLRRFLALQARGSEGERELLAALRERLASRSAPDLGALRSGLDILRHADLRAAASQISHPTLVIAGQRDKLTPPQASHYLAQVMPSARVVEVEGAAHAPFLSHPGFFIEQVKFFLHERI